MGESPTTQDPQAQVDKFRDLARDLECDEDEKAFEEKVRKVASAPTSQLPKGDPKQSPDSVDPKS